jgi:hypothetical protein
MNRLSLGALFSLAVLALLALTNLAVASSNWTAVWRGLDLVTLELGGIRVAEDHSQVDVELILTNGADRVLVLREVETRLQLSGRSVSGGTERFRDLRIQPGESVRIQVENRLVSADRTYVRERIDAGAYSWVVGGRISVVVDDLTDPIWLSFRWRSNHP